MGEGMRYEEAGGRVRRLVRVGKLALELAFALVPVLMIGYLHFFQDPARVFHHHAFHELAILVATLAGAALTWVAWRCYRASGEVFLRWLTLGFLGFTLIYLFHGLFTRLGEHNLWLFILYGPVSRLVMAACLLMGMLQVGRPQDTLAQRVAPGPWRRAVLVFLAVDVLVALLAWSPVAGAPWLRQGFEWAAILLCVASLATRALRGSASPLFNLFAYALVSFALSSWAFTLARPWNHQWWLAHLVFAGGFLLLGYGVLQAFLTTRSFVGVFSQEELFHRLSHALAQTRAANESLQIRERTLTAVLQQLPVGVWIADREGRVQSDNPAARALWGPMAGPVDYPPGQVRLAEGGAELPPSGLALNQVVRGAGAQVEQLLDLRTQAGERHTVVSSAAPIVGEGGEVFGAVSVFQNMSRWLALEQALFDKTRRLEESNRELEQFAYVASHDLQEPLRKVSSFVQLFARRYESLVDETGRSYIAFAVDGAARMRNLIEDLLSYSRVSRAERVHQAVDLGQLLPVVLADLELEIREGGVHVDLGPLPPVRGDAQQLRALYQNLLSNAVKYRRGEAPRVELGGRVEEGMAHLWVCDNGIGIDPAYFERIFVIFQRLHTREEYPGTGIGLAICRKIVESHGGRLWVESAEQQGACFHFTLPLATETEA